MSKLKTIFLFEFKNQITKKSYKITTIIFSIVLIVGLCIYSFVTNSFNDAIPQISNGIVVDASNLINPEIKETFKTNNIIVVNNNEIEPLREEFSIRFVIEVIDNENYKVVEGDLDYLDKIAVENNLLKNKIIGSLTSEEQINELINTKVKVQYDDMEMDIFNGIILSGIGQFLSVLVYLFVILYGSGIAAMITSEKQNRTMELLISTTKAKYLIISKVLAGICSAFIQIFTWFLIGIITALLLNLISLETLMYRGDMTMIIILLLFSITYVVMFLFLFAAFGSLVSKTEDLNNGLMPIMLIFVGSYLISMFSQGTEGILNKILLYFPTTSLFKIVTSIGSLSLVDIGISFVIIIITLIIIIISSIKIYRNATLYYGNDLTMRKIIKNTFKK